MRSRLPLLNAASHEPSACPAGVAGIDGVGVSANAPGGEAATSSAQAERIGGARAFALTRHSMVQAFILPAVRLYALMHTYSTDGGRSRTNRWLYLTRPRVTG